MRAYLSHGRWTVEKVKWNLKTLYNILLSFYWPKTYLLLDDVNWANSFTLYYMVGSETTVHKIDITLHCVQNGVDVQVMAINTGIPERFTFEEEHRRRYRLFSAPEEILPTIIRLVYPRPLIISILTVPVGRKHYSVDISVIYICVCLTNKWPLGQCVWCKV